MGNLVVPEALSGCKVYGVQQMQYTVDGVSGQDYAGALTMAAFQQATAIEHSASSYAEVVRQRQRKIDDLGEVLASIAKALASMKTKDQSPDDKSDADDNLKTAAEKAALYGLSMPLTDGNKIKRGDAMKVQNNVRYALDVEDNNLQQDTVSLQSLLTKRDNAFSNASKIVKKALNASAATIGDIS